MVHLRLDDRFDLGQEFFRWEFATAVAGAVLRINPFDQPNVAESKANTKAVLAKGSTPSPGRLGGGAGEVPGRHQAGRLPRDHGLSAAHAGERSPARGHSAPAPRPAQGRDHAGVRTAVPPFHRPASQGRPAGGAFPSDHRAGDGRPADSRRAVRLRSAGGGPGGGRSRGPAGSRPARHPRRRSSGCSRGDGQPYFLRHRRGPRQQWLGPGATRRGRAAFRPRRDGAGRPARRGRRHVGAGQDGAG